MSDIPQSEEDKAFAKIDLQEGCQTGIYKEVTKHHAMMAQQRGAIISSAFVVWQESGEGQKPRFVVNLSKQSKHWKKVTAKMESLSEFATSIQKGDHLISFDIKKGYKHFRLHPAMWDWFIFKWGDRYYQCIALPFGWGRSPLWFTHFIAVFVKEIRRKGYRVLPYLDDFLIAPSKHGVISMLQHCARATKYMEKLMAALGLSRQLKKGEWQGSTTLEHLGVRIDTVKMRFYVANRKITKVRSLARKLLSDVRMGRRWVSTKSLKHFCGVCVSLTLAMPWARFYTRALYWDMSSKRPLDVRGRCRLSHQSIRDIHTWNRLSKRELSGRPMVPEPPHASLHTDAADMGYGATMNTDDMTGGVPGQWVEQGVWKWKDRASSITYRELKAIRMILTGGLGRELVKQGRNNLLLHIDNQAVVHITNAFVSASRPMMRELRRLKLILDRYGFQIKSEWIPSVANKFADSLSRRFSRGDLQIQRQVRRSVMAGMQAPLDAFPFRPLGEHPQFLRQEAFRELAAPWEQDQVRLLCPPAELIGATFRKVRATGVPVILLIPDWPRQSWHSQVLQMASRVETMQAPPSEVWAAHRRLNPRWRLLMAHINLE